MTMFEVELLYRTTSRVSKDCLFAYWNCCYYDGLVNEMHSERGPPMYMHHAEIYCDGRYPHQLELS